MLEKWNLAEMMPTSWPGKPNDKPTQTGRALAAAVVHRIERRIRTCRSAVQTTLDLQINEGLTDGEISCDRGWRRVAIVGSQASGDMQGRRRD